MTGARIAAGMAVAVGALFLGCGSDGQLGNAGRVRFSQVVHFADTDDFSAKLARKRSLLVALLEPVTILGTDQDTREELTLEVRKDGKKVDAAWPMGFAQYAINLTDDGQYELVALLNGQVEDEVMVTVAKQEHIRWSKLYSITTSGKDDKGQFCVNASQQTSGLENFVLHKNQTITVYVVPEDSTPAPMLGLLPITATTSSPLTLNSELIGHGEMANSLTITPQQVSLPSDTVSVTVKDEETGEELPLQLKASNDDAAVNCAQ